MSHAIDSQILDQEQPIADLLAMPTLYGHTAFAASQVPTHAPRKLTSRQLTQYERRGFLDRYASGGKTFGREWPRKGWGQGGDQPCPRPGTWR